MADFEITVNNRKVPVKKGQTVLEASRAAGIDIPVFCWHPQLIPVGACRICLVEIEKFPKLQVSCATLAAEGMVVQTNSPKVIKARQGVLEFILAHHPLDCPTCDKGGECDLQDITFKYGLDYSRLKEPKRRFIVDPNSTFDDLRIGPEVIRNQNRCIHCFRCTRIVDEVCFEDDLGAYQRGNHTEILPPPGKDIRNLYSGNVVEYCPVGALTNTDWRYKVRVWLTKQAEVICPHCPDGCNLKLWSFHNKIFRATSRPNEHIDRGFICDIGRYGYQFISSNDRLKRPLIRKEGELVETGWEEALDFIKERTDDLKSKLSGSGFFGLIGASSTNEEIYAFQRLMRRVIGTHNIDHRLHRKRKLSLGDEVVTRGIGSDQIQFKDIEDAEVILVFGSDLHSENPITALRVKRAIRHRDAELILVNPRPTPLGVRAAASEIIYKPGTETVLLLGLIHALLKASRTDPSTQTKEVTEFLKAHSNYSVEQAAAICLLEKSGLEEIAASLGKAKKVAIFTGQEVAFHPYRDAILLALYNLQRLCQECRLIVLPLESNTMGARIFGAEPQLLPGRVSLDQKAKFEDIWKGPISERVGKDTVGIWQAVIDDEISCGFVFHADPALVFPDAGVAKSALEKLKLLVVIDTFLTDTARLADVVLPLSSFAESDGTRINWEGRIQYSQRAINPLAESKPGCEVIDLLAEKLGVRFNQPIPQSVYQEMIRFLPERPPANYSQFRQQGSIISMNAEREKDSLAEVKFTPFEGNPDYPFVVLVGHADHHRGTLTVRNESLMAFTDQPFVGISKTEADKLALSDGDLVRVESKFGKVVGKTKILPDFPDRQVLFPNNFQEMKVNLLMGYQEKVDLVRLTKM